ncbi:hypothetical protein [Streptomyces sp. NRRL F-2664]|uniref:hypothetical protein n=1 Tax=Streptomyces sp. NRRL F-2664 TaxID=1463842 RepID=UPI000AF49BC8|nr:hypothetical protein [Streptomyces sp. NRRL F-2664]
MAACYIETAEFFDRLGSGAINAQHYACHGHDLGAADEPALLEAMACAATASP